MSALGTRFARPAGLLLITALLALPAGLPAQDRDGDTVVDEFDLCPDVFDDQRGTDRDPLGDACDPCPLVTDPGSPNADGDALPDACDNCPDDANAVYDDYVVLPGASPVEDISATGTDVGLTIDDGSVLRDIGFLFRFYDQSYTQVRFASNGYLTFQSLLPPSDFLNDCLPSTNFASPRELVAPFWDDLNPNQGGTLYHEVRGTPPYRRSIFQWHQVPHYFAEGSHILQVILFETTDAVQFRYGPSSGFFADGRSATAGVQDATGTVGTEIACNVRDILVEGNSFHLVPQVSSASQLDADGDGFGAACDCDDSDPDVNPDQVEDCLTPADDDCDGMVNCEDPDCFVDKDGDGQPGGVCGEDCDDEDPDNFLRNDEDCSDGRDNDCDGLADCEDGGCLGVSCDDGFGCTVGDACRTSGICLGDFDNSLCDDGLFCNGDELCRPFAAGDPSGCVSGSAPCRGIGCDETLDQCVECVPDLFELDNACAQARLVEARDTVTTERHTLCPGGDLDRIRVPVRTGFTYTFFTTGGLDTRGTLESSDCAQELAANEDCGPGDPNFCLSWEATFDGQVVLEVDSASGAAGTYDLAWQRGLSGGPCSSDPFEPDGQCAQATDIQPLTTPTTREHTLCPAGDVDRFRFIGLAGTTYRFRTEGQDTRLRVRTDLCDSVVQSSEDCAGDPAACLEFTAPLSAPWVLEVDGQSEAVTGPYSLTHEEVAAACEPDRFEPDPLCGQALGILVEDRVKTVERNLCPGADQDLFRFQAFPPATYSFATTGGTDTRARILSADCGQVLEEVRGCRGQPGPFCIDWVPPVGGEYVLAIRGEDAELTGDYQLRHSRCSGDAAEPDGTCGKATAIVVDATERRLERTICGADDIDLFEFQAQEGLVYSFRSEGTTDVGGAVLDEACGRFLLKDENCGGETENFCLAWKAPSTGTFKLGVTGTFPGDYDLVTRMVDDPGLPCEPDPREPDPVCLDGLAITPSGEPQSVSGTLCPADDRDHFSFLAQGGRTYRFWTTGGTDTIGNVRDASCRKLAGNDDCDLPDDLNFCITWTAPVPGTYHLRVRGFSRSQTVGPYQLHFQDVTP